jgi:M6 family metalloprotease-like protein
MKPSLRLLALSLLVLFLVLSCSKKDESDNGGGGGEGGEVFSLTASSQIPLLVVRTQYANATFQSDATTWASKIFGVSEGQLNHYWKETTYNKYQFKQVTESGGIANDGVITINLSGNHPNTGQNSWACHAKSAITAADPYIDFSNFDSNGDGKIQIEELQVIFLVAGGESASGINTPGGVWGMATGLVCGSENGVQLDGVKLLGTTSTGQNGYSQFGERQGSSSSDTWDATIGIIAHEIGHAFFDIPDLYCTSTPCEGIGNFGLMGAGSWGQKSTAEKAGATPIHLSAWSKEKTKVCGPQTIGSGSNQSKTVNAAYSACSTYRIDTSTSGEYFLLENRSKGGYDQGFYILNNGNTSYAVGSAYTGGLAIWHVKDILTSCQASNDCQTQATPLLSLEEAANPDLASGGSRGRTTHLFYSGNATTFDGSSTPNSNDYSGAATNISVTSISAAGSSMTINVTK